MKKNKKYLVALYIIVGLISIFWAYYGSGSEAALGSTMFLVIISFPISYPIGGLMFDIINKFWPLDGFKLIPMCILLALGYLQWFIIVPKLIFYYKKFFKDA